MEIRVANPTGGSLAYPLFPYRAALRQTPKQKPKKVVEPVSSIIVQVHCWLPGAHPTMAVTLDTASTVDDAREAIWHRYQNEIAARTMYCPNMVRNQNVEDYLLVPALANGQPDFLSPSLRGHWPLSKQLAFPVIVVFVETLMAQLQTKELLRRHELELQELLELEDVCRRTMEGIYLGSMRGTLGAIQNFVGSYRQWQRESEEQFRAAVWDMEEEAEGTMLNMTLEAAVGIEGIARARVHNSFHMERSSLSQQAAQDVGSIEAQQQMKELLDLLQQRWQQWLGRGPDVDRLIRRHQLEKGLLFDMTCKALRGNLGPRLPPAPPPTPPPRETKYQLLVCCNLPGAPLELEFTLDVAATGTTVLQSFWDHVLDSNDGIVPRSWPSRYLRDFTLKPPGEDEDPVVLGLPLRDQLDAPYEVEVVEALALVKRRETWDRRTAALGRIRADQQRTEEAHRQRRLACLAQEIQIRNALERWEVEEFYNVTRLFAVQLQRLREELQRKQADRQRASQPCQTPPTSASPSTPPCRGLPVLRARVLDLLEGHEAALRRAMDTAAAYYQAQRFLALAQRPRQEEDLLNKGLMSPLHYRGPTSVPLPHSIPDVLKLQSSQRQPPWFAATAL
eukprot:EG_transcript_4901